MGGQVKVDAPITRTYQETMYCCTAATLIKYLRVICPEKEEKEPQFAIDLFLVLNLSFAHFSPHDPYTLTGM